MIIVSMIAFAGFLLSLAVHLSTFTSLNLMRDFPDVWALHLGAMAVMVPLVVTEGIAVGWKRQSTRQTWTRFLGQFSGWTRTVILVFTIYAVVNFMVGMNYSMKSDNAAGGEQSQQVMLRMFSGHWMIFYLYPACYFLYRRPKRLF